eukprot:c6551_g1_i1.p1 GENE.c6551_g1_i1~~c6551_g1_i1.p1  ORF type:complete len:538 (+),score=107.24 c6551_g1_i1:50-1663(+)
MLTRQALPRLGVGCVLGARVSAFHSTPVTFTDGSGRGRGRGVGSVDKFFTGRGQQPPPHEQKKEPGSHHSDKDNTAASGPFSTPRADLGRGTQSPQDSQQRVPRQQIRFADKPKTEESPDQPGFGRGTRRGKDEVLGSVTPRRVDGDRGAYRGRGGAMGGARGGAEQASSRFTPRGGYSSGYSGERGGYSGERGGYSGRGYSGDRGSGRGGRGTGRGGYSSFPAGPDSGFAPRAPRMEASIDGVGGAEEFSSAHIGGSQDNVDDEDFAGARRTRDFDIEGFLDQDPCYDRTDVTNKVRVIYFGETARELEVQEEHARIHKHKNPGWLLTKHEKILDRARQRQDFEQLAEDLVFDDWAFVDDVDLIGNETKVTGPPVIRKANEDVLPPQTYSGVETRYLNGYEAFQQQRPNHSSTAIDDILRMPGLALQRTPAPKQDMDDFMSAYTRRKERERAAADDALVDEMSLREGIISEENIQQIMATATKQGITEESVRMFASTLSMNRHISFSEKLLRFRMLCGWNAQDREAWDIKATAVLS